MANLYNNIINEEYFMKRFNDSIELHYDNIAEEIGDVIFDIEVLITNLINVINGKKFDEKYMDKFAEEVDRIVDDNKLLIKTRINVEFSKFLKQLDK